jgi:feruloyl esterase
MFNNLQALWAIRVMHDESGKAVLSADSVRVVHRAALARCDEDDGIKDGIIGNPRGCKFDPSELLCKSGEGSDCLTKQQVEAVKKLYAGPSTSSGETLYSGVEVGSELTWINAYVGEGNHPPTGSLERFRWMLFNPAPGASWEPRDFDFDRDYKRLGLMEPIYAPNNPDLRRFKAAGAKLIVYEGWADPEVLPGGIVDYYETVERTMGGRAATQDFFRLFMIPGMNHCTLGDGAFAADYLGALEAWVEGGQSPEQIVSSHVRYEDFKLTDPAGWAKLASRLQFPLDPANIAFSRPVYPYPMRAKYLGRGDPNDARSFGPVGTRER